MNTCVSQYALRKIDLNFRNADFVITSNTAIDLLNHQRSNFNY